MNEFHVGRPVSRTLARLPARPPARLSEQSSSRTRTQASEPETTLAIEMVPWIRVRSYVLFSIFALLIINCCGGWRKWKCGVVGAGAVTGFILWRARQDRLQFNSRGRKFRGDDGPDTPGMEMTHPQEDGEL